MQPRLSPDSAEHRAIRAVRRHAIEGKLPAAAGWLGLGSGECATLLAKVGIEDAPAKADDTEALPPHLAALIDLIWTHRVSDDSVTRLMAGTIASACFGSRHLWQDIGLDGRTEVSGLLKHHFTGLAAGNTRDLKWKRYLFLRLGDQLGVDDLRPPRCDGCEDFNLCY